MPMLETLRGSGLTDIAAVVVRYFGGIKLGTGGLVRAYSDAVRAALTVAPTVRLEHLGLWEVDLPHADAGRVEAELHGRGVHVQDVAYTPSAVRLTLASDDGEGLGALLASLTSGAAAPRPAGTTVVEHPR
jgi:putative IMPACT (imprinted ancient) family translation regulator